MPLHTGVRHRHLPLRYARAFAARSPMSGASLPATEGKRCGRETFVSSLGCSALSTLHASVGRVAANGSMFRRPIQCARLELESMTPFTPACSSPPSVCDAPTRCVAFVDAWRIVAATKPTDRTDEPGRP